MTASLEELEEQVKGLTAEERARLVEVLLESLHSPVSEIEADLAQEIERRIEAFNRGDRRRTPPRMSSQKRVFYTDETRIIRCRRAA